MSWEEMVPETKPCWCGKGTITYRMQMDDWNRTRNSREINCPVCLEQANRESEERRQREESKKALYEKAKALAENSHLEHWLSRYSGLSKKAAWQLYTSGKGYPSLGTFYKNTKNEGLANYMRRSFLSDFEDALKKMNVIDEEVQELLNERERI
ncbi:MAG: hypothetical protein PSX71_12240 [bacterium]|nr:hypothetical protein [bacterium]